MHFTRLDIVGFKSFADKTSLDLPSGVTSIVGPNGCGKTNIAEAIRWVFGEQRVKALRGGKMEDVIFAGTENRRSLGMAEVVLTIDNADGSLNIPFSEVSVGRRLYRSGEAEYFMNNASCRRRDILELFMDTGAGLDAYSFIEQGRIDLVLSSRPEERRLIFEDAAGIVRYRKRQATAMRRLDRTDANLARLADTIQEVQRRCRSLKRQASAAQRYRTLQEELRREELRLARYDYDRAANDLTARARALTEASDRLEGAVVLVAQGDAVIEQGRLRQLEQENALSHAQQGVYNLDTQIDRAEAHIRLLEEKRRAAGERAAAANAELDVLRARLAELAQQIEHVGAESARSEEALVAAAEAVARTHAEMEALGGQIAAADSEVERARQASLLILNDKIAAENRRASVANQLELVGGRLARVADRIRLAEQHVADQAARLGASRTRLQQLLREREETRSALSVVEEERETCHRTRVGVENTLADQREALSAVRSKLRSLIQLRDEFEGFQVGVKTVMTAWRAGEEWTDGVEGVLADLVATDRPYETAIDAALGAHVQSVVTNTAATADRCIRALRESGSGRITCLPLSDLDTAEWQRAMLPTPAPAGVVGWASDLVRVDASVAAAVQHLLGHTLVVEDAAAAAQLAGTLHPMPRMVTLDGSVLEASGIRSGGAQTDGRGLLGRHNEIAELTAEVERMEAEVAAGADQIAGLQTQFETLDQRTAELAQGVAVLDLEIRGLEQDCERTVEALDTGRGQVQHVRAESNAILAEREALLASQQEAAAEFQRLSGEQERVEAELNAAQDVLSERMSAKEALNRTLTQQQVDRSTAEHALAAHRRDVERLGHLQTETEERMAARQADVEDARGITEHVDREVAATRARIQEHGLERERAQRAVTELQERREALMVELSTQEQALRTARQDHQARTDEAHALELDVTRLRDRLDGLRNQILEAYQIDLADAPSLFPAAELDAAAADSGDAAPEDGAAVAEQEEIWDPATAAESVTQLKHRLGKMGPVNLIAIEEYEEYVARRDFLEAQDADLRAARTTLLQVIREVSSTIEQKFLETFNEVAGHFHEVFRVLFEGGRARLSLSDPENVLESGINIDVQPPGKQLQSISLLSGGERALTASALLFAVFRARPSPFCVLDEVDAPLDDPNVIRLCRLIERFAANTQFIIITHNKRTMELADRLYGVTMEERGVSQLVSVHLKREAEVAAAPAPPTSIAAA